jgi:hypothetical protein
LSEVRSNGSNVSEVKNCEVVVGWVVVVVGWVVVGLVDYLFIHKNKFLFIKRVGGEGPSKNSFSEETSAHLTEKA